uniref:Uncharacterized protein n=1 Tax=Panagrolaimus sp. ES5 TaxID=591445 RepID=A0AC34GH66_9BILA
MRAQNGKDYLGYLDMGTDIA